MNNCHSDTLSVIKETARKMIPGCRVVLFGSRARNDYDGSSDYDFLIITRNNIDVRKKRTLKARMRKELAKSKIPSDILIESEEEMSWKTKITGHILKQVVKEGVAL